MHTPRAATQLTGTQAPSTPAVTALAETPILPPRALLVVGGLPGAGKTTFLRRAVRDEEAIVLDSDRVRRRYRMLLGDGAPYALFRPLVHIEHYVRIWWALRAHRPLVVHECATRSLVRRWLARGAIRHGRSAHLLLIDVSPDVAYARQIARRRVVRRRSMRGHVRRWRRLRRQLDSRAGRLTIAGEGYTTIRLLTSAAAEALGALRFDSAPNALSTRPEAAASVGTG